VVAEAPWAGDPYGEDDEELTDSFLFLFDVLSIGMIDARRVLVQETI
jgi:hypothetical protein